MTYTHGNSTVVTINGGDISAFTQSTDFKDGKDVHDTTCYGATRKTYKAGIGDGTITIKGVYDDGASGPRGLIKPLMAAGTAVTFVFRPEGTGSGKAQSSVSVIVKTFNESDPANDMIMWEAELQMTGALNETDQ